VMWVMGAGGGIAAAVMAGRSGALPQGVRRITEGRAKNFARASRCRNLTPE
jgi:hypothetical protein